MKNNIQWGLFGDEKELSLFHLIIAFQKHWV